MQQEFGELVIDVPKDYKRRRFTIRWRTVILLTALAMLMLTAAQEPWFGWSGLAWVGLVPFVVAVVGAKGGWRLVLTIYLGGFAYYLGNLYWLMWVTPAGWIALCFYLACYFVLCGFILRGVYLKRRWPFTLILPIVWVGQEYLRAVVMTGFPWFFIGHSQHENIRLIQISDMFGVYGVTFLVAMVNGLICDLLLRPLRHEQSNQRQAFLSAGPLFLLTFCCFLAVMLYGQRRLNQGKETITQGPAISLIQEVIPQYVKQAGASNEDIFVKHLSLTREAIKTLPGPELIVWPETMVPDAINEEFLRIHPSYLTEAGQGLLAESKSYDARLREVAGGGRAILVGAAALTAQKQEERLSRYNSAYLYLSDGRKYDKRYDKMHLVPFGEVVPFKRSWPWLYKLLNSFTPYDYEYSLDAGTEPTVFEFEDSSGKTNRFSVAICYEDVMPMVVRRLVGSEDGKKRIDFLLNISNDGWFVHGGKDGEPVKPGSELIQHLVICKFRAIENRIGIARAVNTGISAFIKPDGTVQRGGLAGSLSEEPNHRQAVAGFLTDKIHCDSRTTVYGQLGDVFAIVCTSLMGLLALLLLWRKKNVLRKGR